MNSASTRLTIIADLSSGPRRLNTPQKWREIVSTRLIARDDIVQVERDSVLLGEVRAAEVPELAAIFDELFPVPKPVDTELAGTGAPSAEAGGDAPLLAARLRIVRALKASIPTRSVRVVAATPAQAIAPAVRPANPIPPTKAPAQPLAAKPPPRRGVGGRITAFVGFVVVAGILAFYITSRPALGPAPAPSPPADPQACGVRLPSGIQTYYVMYPRTPVRDMPTAATNSGSARVGYKKVGEMLVGEWVASPLSPDACWLKLSGGNGYVSEVNLSSVAPAQ